MGGHRVDEAEFLVCMPSRVTKRPCASVMPEGPCTDLTMNTTIPNDVIAEVRRDPWPYPAGQGHLGVQYKCGVEWNCSELSRRIGAGEYTAAQALHRILQEFNRGRKVLATKWSVAQVDHPTAVFAQISKLQQHLVTLVRSQMAEQRPQGQPDTSTIVTHDATVQHDERSCKQSDHEEMDSDVEPDPNELISKSLCDHLGALADTAVRHDRNKGQWRRQAYLAAINAIKRVEVETAAAGTIGAARGRREGQLTRGHLIAMLREGRSSIQLDSTDRL
eukprot:SAG11_NODE_4661_length_1817_cov_1.245052_1_plen_276_part_00